MCVCVCVCGVLVTEILNGDIRSLCLRVAEVSLPHHGCSEHHRCQTRAFHDRFQLRCLGNRCVLPSLSLVEKRVHLKQ